MVRITQKAQKSTSDERAPRLLCTAIACVSGGFAARAEKCARPRIAVLHMTSRMVKTIGKGGALRFLTIPNVVRNVPLLPMHAT